MPTGHELHAFPTETARHPIKSFTHSCDKDQRYCVLHTAGNREHSAGQAIQESHFQAISSHMGNVDKEAVT